MFLHEPAGKHTSPQAHASLLRGGWAGDHHCFWCRSAHKPWISGEHFLGNHPAFNVSWLRQHPSPR